MPSSRWRSHSRKVILATLAEGRKAGLSGDALAARVSAAYPFGERAMYPYKVWLNEFALLVNGRRKPMGRAKAKGPKLVGSWPGLFDEAKAEGGASNAQS